MVAKVTPLENPLLEAAIHYAARGWPVFPCEVRGKRPLTPHGFKDASTDDDVIRAWWRRWPRANVAVATGPRSFDALDVDGPAGDQSLAALEAKHEELPAGPRQHTGKGRHILFHGGTLGVSAKRIPGLDTRGEGGYVVMAPSVHPSGERYVLEDEDEPIPAPPEWLVSELRTTAPRPGRFGPAPEPADVEDVAARALLEMAGIPLERITEGQRNDRLFRFGASLRARGQEVDAILSVLRLANTQLCIPQLPDAEIVRIAQSSARLEVAAAYRRAEDVISRQVERESAEFAREESVRQAPGESVSESLEALRALLRIHLRGVEKRGQDYYLLIDGSDGEPMELRIRNLLAYDDVRRAIFDATGILVSVQRKSWAAAAVRLRAIAAEVDPGLASETQETLHYLASFLRHEQPEEAETEEDLSRLRTEGHSRIRYAGEVWFLFDALREHCDRAGLREPIRLLWRRIRETGRLREEKTFRFGGAHYTRRYWVVSASLMDTE